jgi:O-6-methylguanine DNA methyltransferase
MNAITLPIETTEGLFVSHYSTKGLARLDFPNAAHPPITARNVAEPFRSWHRCAERAVKAVLAGRAIAELPPLDLDGTDFQKAVWQLLLRIPLGQTESYGELAARLGNPKAMRAVGGACGANPIPLLVPCHRVLAANRKIGGFSGGMDWKYKLLTIEGVLSATLPELATSAA